MVATTRTHAHLGLALLLMLGLTTLASAQGFGFSYGRHGHHRCVSVGFSTGWGPGPVCGPVVYAPAHVWVPAHYETVTQQVWVPGCARQVWVDARYETRYDGQGRPYQVMVCAGHFETIQDPGHYENRAVSVWVEGHGAGARQTL